MRHRLFPLYCFQLAGGLAAGAFLTWGLLQEGASGAESDWFAKMRALEQGVCEVYERSAPAVVVVEVEWRGESADGRGEGAVPEGGGKKGIPVPGEGSLPSAEGGLRSEGSGFVARENGVILTNFHVVSSAERIVVRLRDGRRLSARVLGADERLDVAVLQVEARGLPVLEFAESATVRVGQWVGAIGAPFSQEWSFTSGMISGKGRSRLLGPTSTMPLLEDYLQTDAMISPGHSGGPLLNLEGRVVGMNTLITRVERGLAFAVPSHLLQQALSDILAQGRVSHPWLGIRVESLGETPSLAERLRAAQSGVVVLSVEPNGPAFKTDLRPADVIQKVDGVVVRSALELQRELFSKKVGQSVQVSVWRATGVKGLVIQTVEVPESFGKKAPELSEGRVKETNHERFGLTLKEIKGRGVRVEAVEEGSWGAQAELAAGDLITEVEGRAVRTQAECLQALRAALSKGGSGGAAILQIERQGRRTFAVMRGR